MNSANTRNNTILGLFLHKIASIGIDNYYGYHS